MYILLRMTYSAALLLEPGALHQIWPVLVLAGFDFIAYLSSTYNSASVGFLIFQANLYSQTYVNGQKDVQSPDCNSSCCCTQQKLEEKQTGSLNLDLLQQQHVAELPPATTTRAQLA